MLKRVILSLLLCFSLSTVIAQNVSNRGKLFWVAHMGHIDGTGSNFALYITTDAASSALVRVTIPGGTYTNLVVVPSNQVVVVTLPSNQTYMNCTDCILNQGVKIESLNHDIVVYAHIYSNARSDATLLIPVETLGKEYYALAFTQSPSSGTQRSEFMLIGVEDSTYVDIYPTVDVLPSKSKNSKYTVMLMEGEVYHAQSLTDVSGTRIVARSANGIACKKVAAFSGSSFTRVGCSGAGTGDNLYQQLFPTTSWGMEFVTAPLKSRNGDQFRVLAKYDSTKVILNNGTPVYLNEGEHYSFVSYEANHIICDYPVTLAQYPRTQNCDGNTGDPTLIVIPPIEQMVKYVAMYSSPYQNITGQYLNIITNTTDTGYFRIDGQKAEFTAMTNKPAFAYAQLTVSSGIHRMWSDSFFQVVAYGFGNVEAYGYAGGTNIKNLVQSITASADSMCMGDSLSLTAEVNYVPTSMKWYFGDGRTDTSNYHPKITYTNPGLYTISLVTRKDGLVDCGSTDSTVYRVRVHGYPTASFSVDGNCLKDTFLFKDLSVSNTGFSYVSKWKWTFGDSSQSAGQHPVKYFNRLDSMPVELIVWNNNLCSDTVYGAHFVNPHPVPALIKNDTCPGLNISFIDASTIVAGANTSWEWVFDSVQFQKGAQVNYSSLIEGKHKVSLLVSSDSGCANTMLDSFVIYPKPTAKFSTSNHCFGAAMQVTDSSLLAFQRFWNYSDTAFSGPASVYTFTDTGNYALRLKVISSDGCEDSFDTSVEVYPNPLAWWKSTGNCQVDAFVFEPDFDTSAYASWIYSWEIDGTSYTGKAHQLSFNPGWKQVKMDVVSAEQCSTSFSGQVYVNPNPIAKPIFTPNCKFEPGTLLDASDYVGSSVYSRNWTWGFQTFTDSVSDITPLDGIIPDVNLRVQTDSNCFDSANVTLFYHPLPVADFTSNGVCPQDWVSHQNQTIVVSGDPLVNLEWEVSQGDTSTLDSIRWKPNSGGDYTVSLKVTSQKGCKDTLVKTQHILDIPVPVVDEFPSCVGFLAELEDQSTVNEHSISGWDWVWDTKSYSGKRIGEVFIQSGNFAYSLSLTTDAGCVFPDIYSDSIFISPKPTVAYTFSPDFVLLDEPEFTFTNKSQGGSQFLWSFGDGQQSTMVSPKYSYQDTGVFEVKLLVHNIYGCSDSVSQFVRVRPMLECYVPNAFTPDGNHINDLFGPVCEGMESFKMQVFNRWGQEIFHSEDGAYWEPFKDGVLQYPEGIYVYYIVTYDYRGDPKYFKGNIYLMR